MQISHEDNLDGVSNGLPIKPDGHKWDWLTLQAIFPLLISLALVAQAAATPAYPLRPSANGRYLVDANGAPFLIIGDAPHSILANLNRADVPTYLANRQSLGFNSLWIELLCDYYTFGYGNEGDPNYGRDVNGNNPFTGYITDNWYDLTTPNGTYWSHVDYIVQQAAAHGLQCLLTPLDQGGWSYTAIINGTSRCYQYGQFLGNRYKNMPNIVWQLGNDFQGWHDPSNDALILAIGDGIKSVDTNHPMTIELDYPTSNSQNNTNWISRINVNSVYTYQATYVETWAAYAKPTVMPVLFLEGSYDNEGGAGPSTLRKQKYFSLTAGALSGYMSGSYWIDRFDPAWQQHLNTQADHELGYFRSFTTNIQWHNLVPDESHAFLTGGYGSDCHDMTTCDVATAARSPDGSLGVIYTPVSHTMTVAMGNFAGPVTARWFDPTNNTFTTVSGSPFPNTGNHNFTTPGNNSDGDPDWVLLLQSGTGSPTPTPVPTPTATPTATPRPTPTPRSGPTARPRPSPAPRP